MSRREGTWSAQFQAWLTSLATPDAVFVCVEDGLRRPSDPVMRSLEQPAFFYGDSVFSYGPPEFDELPTRGSASSSRPGSPRLGRFDSFAALWLEIGHG